MHLIESRAPAVEASVSFRFDRKASCKDLVKIIFGHDAGMIKDTSIVTFMSGTKDDYALSNQLTMYAKISNSTMLAITPTPTITNTVKFEVLPNKASQAWIRVYLKKYDATLYQRFRFIMISMTISNGRVVLSDADRETVSNMMAEIRRFEESLKTST